VVKSDDAHITVIAIDVVKPLQKHKEKKFQGSPRCLAKSQTTSITNLLGRTVLLELHQVFISVYSEPAVLNFTDNQTFNMSKIYSYLWFKVLYIPH